MKRFLVILVFLCCALPLSAAIETSTSPLQCESDGSFRSYFGPGLEFEVTIYSDKGVVSVMEVPEGVFLGVSGEPGSKYEKPERDGEPYTFSGDLTIRTRRADEMADGESRSAGDIMAKAPVVIELGNALVAVKKIGD